MRPKNVSRRVLLIAILLGLTPSVALLSYFPPNNSINNDSELLIENVSVLSSTAAVLSNQEEQAHVALPVRLTIPSINVDAPIEYVGLDPDGLMDVPKEQANVAWFKLGQRPGEEGSAVIAGHYGWQNMKGSVFDNLHTLRKGDRIYVEDDKGDSIAFVVRESRRYDPQADASDVFGSNDGKAHLNLVTCEGEWDKVSETYSKRLVVFTEKE